jgi:CRP/FNR family transcriptional regulator, cyclic AMP receptor protein
MALQQSTVLEALKTGSLFSTLTDVEMEFLAQRARPRSVSAGELLFSEGEPCAGLFTIASGRIQIFKTSASGREHVLAIEGPGSSIAELPVFDGGTYPASAAAVEPSDLIFISRDDFRAMCLENPEIALKVLTRSSTSNRQDAEARSFTGFLGVVAAWREILLPAH